jgi:ATP-dependent Lon protease
LDKSIYGHDKVKKQITRIIGHWINGDMDNMSSHVIGFEGNPGIGKTTLAKGLADCLKDEYGASRPFSLIALGGDSNASTLQGHGYTYVGSNFGSIVQILMDSKCMNPIILFDEVDKISRTEHGKEIIGILTHLLDTTQNKTFQDKYFAGVDLDLSKALFILSYNDVNAIDKILLDRITRIKFDSLSVEDKIIICKKHLLPDLCKQIGLKDMITLADETIKFIIEEYTLEPGVRKLKEKLFEIIGEINLDIIQNNNEYEIPMNVTIHDIKNKYFKEKREIIIKQVPKISMIGYANGMYATTLGSGGTLPIHAKFFPSEHFLKLKLTGLQQDVMKESMHVALTVAWNLTADKRKKELRQLYDGVNNKYGINIHPGDASVQKDGPSAGGIITLVLYSLLNDIPIKSNTAMTGEIQMSGDISAIGGLNYKILGSIKSGVKEFIYPTENKKDFDEFYEKYKNDSLLVGITFYAVENIQEALNIMLE